MTGNSSPDQDYCEQYRCVVQAVERSGVPTALGGGVALGVYLGEVSDRKDLDFYVESTRKEELIAILAGCGMADYYQVKPYDREWIYRSYRGDLLVDVIWAMANQRATVDHVWIAGGREVCLFEANLRVLPVEELIWSKLYVLQQDRCDWPDIFNLLRAAGNTIDWDHLLDRVRSDLSLMRAVLAAFSWLDPHSAREFPWWLWDHLGLPLPSRMKEEGATRARLLDSRPWYPPAKEQSSC